MWQRHEVSEYCWKNGSNGVATSLQFVKKTEYLWSTTNQSTIEQGMPLFADIGHDFITP